MLSFGGRFDLSSHAFNPLSYPYFLHQHTFILCHLLSISTYCSHMTPIYLSSPILTLFAPFHSLALSDHLSPPLLNQVSLIYQTFPSLHTPLFVSLHHAAKPFFLGLSRTDENNTVAHWLMTRGCGQTKKPIKAKGRQRV